MIITHHFLIPKKENPLVEPEWLFLFLLEDGGGGMKAGFMNAEVEAGGVGLSPKILDLRNFFD